MSKEDKEEVVLTFKEAVIWGFAVSALITPYLQPKAVKAVIEIIEAIKK